MLPGLASAQELAWALEPVWELGPVWELVEPMPVAAGSQHVLAENMVIAAESLGLGSCFIGGTPYMADRIISKYKLPRRVFPLVQLAMGFPAEDPPPRPRYPLDLTLFEDEYPDLDEAMIARGMKTMDEGYLAQDYYREAGLIIPLDGDREETFSFDDYSWTEHISRKTGQWLALPEELLEQLENCGFDVYRKNEQSE